MASSFVYEKRERVLTVTQLSLAYGKRTILCDVNIAIDNIVRPNLRQGQVVALLGPSGVGKTQFFRCLAGLQKPTAGVVAITDKQIPVTAGMVGVVAQNYILFKHRTVMGNLLVAAKQRGYSDKDAEARALELLAVYGLVDRKDAYPGQLSGGQRQRVAIMQQVLSSGHFLLMDEPFSGLDPLMKDTACQTIQKLSQLDELNTSIIVTHDIESAVAVADTVWLMGRTFDEKGASLGASIKKQYDLIEAGLAWQPSIQSMPQFRDMVTEIKAQFQHC